MNIKFTIINRFPALASRDFVLFIVGQFVSVIGTWMQNTVQPYLAYDISRSSLALGLIGAASALPTFLLALPAGVLVERWDKRKTVIILQAVMGLLAFTLATLTFSDRIQIWHIALIAFIFGTASTVETTARQSMLIELVGRSALPSAIALQTTAFKLGRVLGPRLAAPFLAAGKEENAFLVNGLSFLFVIVGLFFARPRYQIPREESGKRNLIREFCEGAGYIARNHVVASIVLMAGLLGMFGLPLLQQLPALARDVLKTLQDTESLVALRTSQVYIAQGFGALAAALLAAYFSSARHKGWTLTLGQIAFTVGMIFLSGVTYLPLALTLLASVGSGSVPKLVTMHTLVQVQVPNDLRGRVFSFYLWALQGVSPLGSLLIGWGAQAWGLSTSMFFCGLFLLTAFALIHLLNPRLRAAEG
jgi:MFS family permease